MTTDPGTSPFDLFQWLPDELCAEFEAAARCRTYKRGALIYSQGEPGDRMFRILSGAARLSVARSDGRELLYLHFEPGACFGVSSLIDGDPWPQTAEAAEDLEVQVLDKAAFDRLRARHFAFGDALLRLATRHMRVLSDQFANAHLEDLTARLASRLVSAAESFGVVAEGGIGLSLRLSQAELALMVGGSRQSVNRALQQFHNEGLLSIPGGRLVIRSLEGLRAKAGGR